MKRRLKNSAVRPREFLTPSEVERLLSAVAKTSGNPLRDYTMILVAYGHGLRCSELCKLRWAQVDLANRFLNVERLKKSNKSTQPLWERELKLLRKLRTKAAASDKYVFTREKPGPLKAKAVQPIDRSLFYRIVAAAGEAAGFPFPVHPHMLRHACGYKLANDGTDVRVIQAFLGHRDINQTVKYTELAPERFQGLFKE